MKRAPLNLSSQTKHTKQVRFDDEQPAIDLLCELDTHRIVLALHTIQQWERQGVANALVTLGNTPIVHDNISTLLQVTEDLSNSTVKPNSKNSRTSRPTYTEGVRVRTKASQFGADWVQIYNVPRFLDGTIMREDDGKYIVVWEYDGRTSVMTKNQLIWLSDAQVTQETTKKRISVYWPKDNAWYNGWVQEDADTIVYDDGEKDQLSNPEVKEYRLATQDGRWYTGDHKSFAHLKKGQSISVHDPVESVWLDGTVKLVDSDTITVEYFGASERKAYTADENLEYFVCGVCE